MTALAEILTRAGAVRDEEGCALHFGNPVAELTALRAGGVVALRNDYGLLEISGPDAANFLHRLTANDVNKLAPNTGHVNLFLNAKGRILAEFRLFKLAADSGETRFLAMTPQACSKSLADLLEKYHFTEKLTVLNRHSRHATAGVEALSVVGVYGANALQALHSAMAGGSLPAAAHQIHGYSARSKDGASIQGWITALPATIYGAPGVECILPETAAGDLFEGLRAGGLPPIGMAALGAASLEAATPRFGADFDDQVLPPEAGLTHAYSLTKGCYIGQEIMARIQTYGHHNKQITALLIDGGAPVPRDAAVYSGENKVGAITSSIVSPTLNRPIALAYVNVNHRSAGTPLAVEIEPGRRVTAQVAAGPFVSAGT